MCVRVYVLCFFQSGKLQGGEKKSPKGSCASVGDNLKRPQRVLVLPLPGGPGTGDGLVPSNPELPGALIHPSSLQFHVTPAGGE